MELFTELGAEIEELWRGQNYSEDIFPALAADALRRANLPEKLTAWEILEWTLKQTNLPEQRDAAAKFGDPPITLYNAPRFHIDVYFWLDGTTAIHQHGFCGAFQVLHGSSIHSHYEFEREETINVFAEIGKIKLKVCELLEVGNIKAIDAGSSYIHSLFHLEQPSATIVVRTFISPVGGPQYAYHKPSLAIFPFFEEPATNKKLQTMAALIRARHPEADRLISEWLAAADFQTSYYVLQNLKTLLPANALDQMFNPAAAEKRFDQFFEIVKTRHGKLGTVLEQVFANRENVNEIIKRRSYVTDPEQRFFLALLMNVEGREPIFELVKRRFPDSEPLDKILDWTFDLAQTRIVGTNLPNALGIENFDDFDLLVLENLLQNFSDAEISEAVRGDFPTENAEELNVKIVCAIEKIRGASIFRPFFAD